jgi:NADP-dependent 3-hydroxy acid dehydrogenase YdfG
VGEFLGLYAEAGLAERLAQAGYRVMGAIEEATLEVARAAFATNVLGTMSVVQAAVPLLREQRGGHIVAVSSLAGLRTYPLAGIYHATKFAVEGMLESLAQEVD